MGTVAGGTSLRCWVLGLSTEPGRQRLGPACREWLEEVVGARGSPPLLASVFSVKYEGGHQLRASEGSLRREKV